MPVRRQFPVRAVVQGADVRDYKTEHPFRPSLSLYRHAVFIYSD